MKVCSTRHAAGLSNRSSHRCPPVSIHCLSHPKSAGSNLVRSGSAEAFVESCQNVVKHAKENALRGFLTPLQNQIRYIRTSKGSCVTLPAEWRWLRDEKTLNMTEQPKEDPSCMHSTHPAALLTLIAFPQLQVLLKLLQRPTLLAIPISMKHVIQICYLLSFPPKHTKSIFLFLV